MRNLRISQSRIADDLAALSAITDPGRPWTRRAFSPRFDEGRRWLAARFAAAGLAVTTDAGGNLLGRRAGSGALGTILLGSHSDTVPDGGRFDGVAGVVAALEVARMLNEHGLRLRHDLCVADFLAEEVSVFGVSCIGSRAMAGVRPDAWSGLEYQGRSLAQAIRDVGGDPDVSAKADDVKAFFELHIEQGLVLQNAATDLGLVTAIAGITRIEVTLTGRPDHAGTTPMDLRADALVAGAGLVTDIAAEAGRLAQLGSHFTATVGEFSITPGAANVVPGSVRLLIDARAVERPRIEGFIAWLQARLGQLPKGITAAHQILSDNPPTPMDPGLIALSEGAADRLGASRIRMASGAGHDAAFIARIAPAAMIFVPSLDGRSHCPEEFSEISDIALGAEVMAEAILAFDAQG
ncbi:Zn-dependent hydrolase [Xinfangfangia sp. D13-10-4-6]|uniref:Zn-dependent hydrolase n=1 Tax=Pseudogemmobacter hezensis TaxID=2737662 RepID=UPI0015566B64|nr:Zn-dependent hydrolase [Pseudogemmobacter hezensis]NPD14746.1 Zn-dependent hydrolase [Pseudogemmobacter hezensis]